MYKKFVLFFVGYFISMLFGYSQEFNNFKFIDIKEGITKRAVSAIKQDSEGFIWFGTNGAGLYRYDGINYKLYEYQWDQLNSLNSSLINSIFEDSTGKLWICTDEGLNLYNKEFDNFVRINLNSSLPVAENYTIQIKTVEELNEDELIVGTYGYGSLFKVNKSTFRSEIIPFNEELSNSFLINSILKVSKNKFYIGSSNGLYLFDFENKEKIIHNKIISEVSIETLFKDTANNLWIGTRNDGLYKISLSSSKKEVFNYKFTNKRILSIIEYDNHIICGTENEGLVIINMQG